VAARLGQPLTSDSSTYNSYELAVPITYKHRRSKALPALTQSRTCIGLTSHCPLLAFVPGERTSLSLKTSYHCDLSWSTGREVLPRQVLEQV
jgi:hypothetical protein